MAVALALPFLAWSCSATPVGNLPVVDAGQVEAAAPACLAPASRCGDACVELANDPTNCGACGDTCAAGDVCSAGTCALACSGGSTKCGARCVDLLHDPADCGACGVACSIDDVCANGVCSFECSGGATKCGQACVDVVHDPANCGGCGDACPAGQLCANGACSLVCLGGTVQCGSVCVELSEDPAHCGSCGRACPAGVPCIGGVCASPPDAGSSDAAPSEGGDPCAPLKYCSGQCVDTTTDPSNCGACFSQCRADQVCASSACSCPSGQSDCNGKCTDTSTDPNACGACGAACGTNQICTASLCVCAPTATSCGTSCVTTSSDSENCGACGALCAAPSVCTSGSCAAATSAWPMLGGDGQHDGAAAGETGVPPLTALWSTPAPIAKQGAAAHPVVSENGRVFVTYAGGEGATEPIVALDLSDGSQLWTYNFGNVFSVGHPAVVGGAVYVQHGASVGTPGLSPHLYSFDAASGNVQWAATFTAQWEDYWAPLVAGGAVYIDGGTYGGLYGFAIADGSQMFFNDTIGQYDSWSPTAFGADVYTYVAGYFRAHDPSQGTTLWSVQTSWSSYSYSMNTAPVFGAQLGYVISPPNLIAIDPAKQAVAWTANGSYVGTPAYANGTVFGTSGGSLVARDALTGNLSWTFVGDESLSYPPVMANGYLYVSSASNVYAVSLTTHEQVWTAAVGGWLAIASGRLLVAGSDGTVHAFLMK